MVWYCGSIILGSVTKASQRAEWECIAARKWKRWRKMQKQLETQLELRGREKSSTFPADLPLHQQLVRPSALHPQLGRDWVKLGRAQ